MATEFGASAVICFRSSEDDWYRFDLESLAEEMKSLSPLARLDRQYGVGWTLIGDDIYCTGGVLIGDYTVSKALYKLDSTTNPHDWVTISCNRKFPRYQPFVFAIDRKIYTLGGDCFPEGLPADRTYGGEVYDLDTDTWKGVASNWEDFTQFSGAPAARVDKYTVVFYSFRFSSLLFYDVAKDQLICKDHPPFGLFGGLGVPRGFLMHVMRNMQAVVYGSTLYWLHADLHLYGYDFVKMRWFRSKDSLDGAFKSLRPNEYPWSALPVLFNLDNNGTFLAIHSIERGILGITSFMVCKQVDSLTVSVKSSRTLGVDPFCIPLDGVMRLKNVESS